MRLRRKEKRNEKAERYEADLVRDVITATVDESARAADAVV